MVRALRFLGPCWQFMRRLPNLLCFVGVIIFVVEFVRYSSSSLPYQDATPELLVAQRGRFQLDDLPKFARFVP